MAWVSDEHSCEQSQVENKGGILTSLIRTAIQNATKYVKIPYLQQFANSAKCIGLVERKPQQSTIKCSSGAAVGRQGCKRIIWQALYCWQGLLVQCTDLLTMHPHILFSPYSFQFRFTRIGLPWNSVHRLLFSLSLFPNFLPMQQNHRRYSTDILLYGKLPPEHGMVRFWVILEYSTGF